MSGLLDFLGGLNRGAVAGTLGAPVDSAALGLNALIAGGGYAGHKLGLLSSPPDLIDKPVGGSDWVAEKMRRMGLLKDNPGSTGDNWGSATGNLLPMLAAAKAPQIAKGLLGMGENAAIPQTLNRQAGVIDPSMLGLQVNKDGTVSLYHGTTKQGAKDIVSSKTLKSAGEPNVYLTTAKDAGYGDGSLVQVDVHPRFLNLDDEFPNGRMDFSMDAPKQFAKVAAARLFK